MILVSGKGIFRQLSKEINITQNQHGICHRIRKAIIAVILCYLAALKPMKLTLGGTLLKN